MKRSTLVCTLGISFVLSGCFFTKESDNKTKKQKQEGKLISGKVSMLDVQGISNDGVIQQRDLLVTFGRKSNAQRLLSREHWHSDLNHLSLSLDRGEPCKVLTQPKSQAASNASFISVGRVAFGIKDSQKLYEVPKGEDNKYYVQLSQGTFPPALYQLVVEGSEEAAGFKTLFPMPEEIVKPAVNAQPLENGPVLIKKSDGIVAEWSTPKKVEDYDTVFVRLFGETASDLIVLNCGIKEKDLVGSAGTTKWTIPASYVEQFAKDVSDAELYLIRADLVGVQGEDVGEIEMDGIRAWIMKTSFVN